MRTVKRAEGIRLVPRPPKVESTVDEDFLAEQLFDQGCLDTLVRFGMQEAEAVCFLGSFLTRKTGQSWTLIQIGGDNSPKFFVLTSALTEEPLKN